MGLAVINKAGKKVTIPREVIGAGQDAINAFVKREAPAPKAVVTAPKAVVTEQKGGKE